MADHEDEMHIIERLTKLEVISSSNADRIKKIENAVLGVLGALSAAWAKLQGFW